MIYKKGDKVKIIDTPSFFTYMNKRPKMLDLSHLIGLEGTVVSFLPNPFGNLEKNIENEVGFYYLELPLTKKGIPQGLLAQGFDPKILVKVFDIWMEGYAATGERGYAQKIGEGTARTFDEAIINYMGKTPDHGIEENGRGRYKTEEAYNNRSSNWNIWACNLYDNEAEARESFG